MTDIITIEGNNLESEFPIFRQHNQLSDNLELPMGSFLSLNSEQSNEREEGESITSTTDRVKILKFEDNLTDEDHRQFEIIYESLLLEGKAGNLTKSTLEVALAQKPPAWLQVMHERLKHLIISSETFQNKRKRDIRLKEKCSHIKRIDYGEVRSQESCTLGICPTTGQKKSQLKTAL